jgi:hypothetical protein
MSLKPMIKIIGEVLGLLGTDFNITVMVCMTKLNFTMLQVVFLEALVTVEPFRLLSMA